MSSEFKLVIGEGADAMVLPSRFTPCTNCGGDDGPWIVEFIITREGVYPFRLVFFSRGGGSSLEWLEVAPMGSRLLINENAPGAIVSYVPASALPQGSVLGIQKSEQNVSITWQGPGTLESATSVTGPWEPVNGATSPHTIVPDAGARRFYRLRQ